MKKFETAKRNFITLVLAKRGCQTMLDAVNFERAADPNNPELLKKLWLLHEEMQHINEKIGVLEHHKLVKEYGMTLNEICNLYNTYFCC